MGGEVLVLGIIAMGTWLIPFFGLPVPIIGLVWGIMILRRRPAKKAMTISGVVLSSIGLFLSVSYTIISVIGTAPDITDLNPGGGDSNLPPPGPVDWQADGEISSGEYENYLSFGSGYQIYWKSDSQFVYVGVQAGTEGWVSLSFIDDLRDGGMDTIYGFVDEAGQAHVSDSYSADRTMSELQKDEESGGQFSLLEWEVKEIAAIEEEEEEPATTVMEFRRRLDTGDNNDVRLLPGPNLFIWAYGYSDDITASMTERGYGVIELD